MPQKRHRIDFSLLRRRQNTSSTSSSSLSATVPVLESPLSYHALASQNISEATLKQNKLNRAPVKPSMFFEDKEEYEDGTVPNLTTGDHKDGRTTRAAHKSSIDERPLIRTKSEFFDDAFNSRCPWVSPSARISQDSLVVIEIKMNINVRELLPLNILVLATDMISRSKIRILSSRASPREWRRSTRDLRRSWWLRFSRTHLFGSEIQHCQHTP
jgi:hypothetical protein